MTEEQKLLRIKFLAQRVGIASMLAFKKESLNDILTELEKLYKLSVQEYQD